MAAGVATSEPTAGWASGPLGAVQAADREIARHTAVRARSVAAFAAERPASGDRPAGEPGAMSEERRATRAGVLADVSEWAAQELALALEISGQAAETLLERSLTLVQRLPRTLEALESGALHVGHLFQMLERVGPIADDAKRAELEATLLDWMSGRVTTPAQLADKARRLGLLVDARDSARRLAAAVRRRGVHFRPDTEDGMAQLVALLTVPEVAALVDALGRYADALEEPGDERTRAEKMADCLMDLVLRPGENGLAPVQAHLTVVAAVSTLLGGDQPGEIAGQVVPAELVRALARALGLLPAEAADEDDASLDTGGAEVPGGAGLHDLVAERVPRGASDVERALEEWWRDVERRVLTEEPRRGAPAREYEPRHHAGRRSQDTRTTTARAPDLRRTAVTVGEQDAAGDRDAVGEQDAAGDRATAGDRDVLGDRDAARSPEEAAEQAVEGAGRAQLEFVRALGRADRAVRHAQIAAAVDEHEWQGSRAGRVSAATDALQALRDAGTQQRAALGRLLDATAGGGLAERPRIAVVDALTGALMALTDTRQIRRLATCGRPPCVRRPGRCTHDLGDRPGLGPPPPTPAYRPGAALDRYLRTRDRRCRQPGCRRPVPRGGELDHDRPWPDGPTSATNLVGYCTPHHRGKHQAPGWRHALAADGSLTVTTPSGLRATSTPPPF